jgi:hypothetical protein
MVILIFTVCSLINVMLNTVKTIIMYRNEKLSSSLINAITYGFYTIIVVLMAGDMDLWLKIILTAGTNFVGVWASMAILDRFKKDKLWKVEATVSDKDFKENAELFNLIKVPHNYIDIEGGKIVNFYCATQKQSLLVKDLLTECNAKYFVSESKSL